MLLLKYAFHGFEKIVKWKKSKKEVSVLSRRFTPFPPRTHSPNLEVAE